MDNSELDITEKINLMKEDYENEWWRPSSIDNYDLKNKVIKLFNILN